MTIARHHLHALALLSSGLYDVRFETSMSNMTERIELPLRPQDYIARTPTDSPASRGPKPRRKFPVRR